MNLMQTLDKYPDLKERMNRELLALGDKYTGCVLCKKGRLIRKYLNLAEQREQDKVLANGDQTVYTGPYERATRRRR